MISKPKLYIIIAIVVIVILVGVYFSGKSAGSTLDSTPLPADDPSNEGKISAKDSQTIESVVDAMQKDMDGINLTHDNEPYQKLLQMSDTLFVATVKAFNNKYGSVGTLSEWIAGEKPDAILGRSTIALFDSINSRLERLGLK